MGIINACLWHLMHSAFPQDLMFENYPTEKKIFEIYSSRQFLPPGAQLQ